MPEPKITLDPARLTALARVRDRHRATVAGMNDRAATLRERRLDLQKRASIYAAGAEGYGPVGRADAERQAAELRREAELAARELAELQDEISAEASAAADAGRLLMNCLRHAREVGLEIPHELALEAQERHVITGVPT